MFFPSLSTPLTQRVPEAIQSKLGPDPASNSGAIQDWMPQNQQEHGNAEKRHPLRSVRTWLAAHLKPWGNLWRHGKTEKIEARQIQAPHLGAYTYYSSQGPVTCVVNQDAAALVQKIRAEVLSANQRKAAHPDKPTSNKAPAQSKQTPVPIEYLPRALTRPITVDEICFNPHLEAQEKENRRILAQTKFWDTENLIDPFHELVVDEQE